MKSNERIYKNSLIPLEERVEDLLKRMTLEEKAEQLQFDAPENERLGIPKMDFGECLHGFRAGFFDVVPERPATSFPQIIAMVSTWEPELVKLAGEAIARECRAYGKHHCYSPVLDVCRDPRWGRTEETFGEDPYLCTEMGVAYIEGLQGTGDKRFGSDRILATAKHYPAYGEPLNGINGSAMDFSERTLREAFLPPFEAAVKRAKVGSVMPAHSDINGVPSHANRYVLTEILREEWGFDGFVVSDNRDIYRLFDMQNVAGSMQEAAKLALEAGVDMEMVLQNKELCCYGKPLLEGIKCGIIDEGLVDASVRRILKAKFQLGLFEGNSDSVPKEVINCTEHRQLALEIAKKSVILLKNAGNILPLDRDKIKTIAVIGPNADSQYTGDYAGNNTAHTVSILEGIRNLAGESINVLHARGCSVSDMDEKSFEEAVKAAAMADIAIVAVGEDENTSGEGFDRDELCLPGVQEDLVKAVFSSGTPTIVILQNGRPLTVGWISEHIPVILESWFAGCEGGTALAEILFGECNPSGKLTITFPRKIGHIPAYYYKKPQYTGKGKGQYVDSDKSPLYPFGFGLSYTEFLYDNLKVYPEKIMPGEKATVSVSVTNKGKRDGREIVQLYIRDMVSTFTRPVKELKGFKSIYLKAGETQTVTFDIGFGQLCMLDRNCRKVVEPGKFTVYVGGNSVDCMEAELEVSE